MASSVANGGAEHEYAVLFLYHRRHDALTWKHYALTLLHNPGVPVIPLTDGGGDLPGTVDVRPLPSTWDTRDIYHHPDTILYRWFPHRTVSAQRYVVAEYDVLPELPYPEFLATVWDKPVAGHEHFTYEQWPDWNWFHYDLSWGNVPDYLLGHLAAICPFGFMLLSHEALATIVANAVPHRLFCETRIGTACRRMGIPVAKMGNTEGAISFRQSHLWRQPGPSIYHPVKDMAATIEPAQSP